VLLKKGGLVAEKARDLPSWKRQFLVCAGGLSISLIATRAKSDKRHHKFPGVQIPEGGTQIPVLRL
jgi:hypothetical protein